MCIGPTSGVTGDCIRRGKLGYRATDTGLRRPVETAAKPGATHLQAEDGWLPPRAGKGQEGSSPGASRGSTGLPTLCLWTSGLQNHKGMKFLTFSVTSVWRLVIAALGCRHRLPSHVSPVVQPHVPSCSFPDTTFLSLR